ncbi:hypothetical protein NX784_24130 [Massilia pinisoli]|uniref:DUF2059 domain-containing protein n=1 Tax=Massilia pinisoli TaxID=1772194 RepID=A0ABT1ZXP4_9BURK|nr:hypothetical protein [Massilia pinisoli]MCS0584679.1 hypothetical protein [Massilia pinisoli]
MKFAVQAVLGVSLLAAFPAFAATPAPATMTAAPTPAHVKAVQDLLGAMEVDKVLRGVASRSRYPTEAQRKAVFAKLDKTPPSEVCQRLAPQLAHFISADTAVEMTRFYRTPYGRQVIHDKYNSRAQIIMPGMTAAVPAEEKNERKRPAYVRASKELADAQPMVEHEAFKLLQVIDREKR